MVTGTGWIFDNGLWYYLDHDKVVTGWLFDKGNWYYLYPKSDDNSHIEGSMAKDATIQGWYVDSSGKWITEEVNSNSNETSDSSLTENEDDDLLTLIKHLDNVAKNYGSILDLSNQNRRVLNLLRYYKYGNTGSMFTQISWMGTLGDDDSDFVAHVYGTDDFDKISPYIQKNSIEGIIHGKKTDLPHLAATTLGYYSSPLVPDFWTGWGGDLATAMSDVSKLLSKGTNKTPYKLATEVIGDDSYTCPRLDIEADIDAIQLSSILDSDTIGNLLDNYFQNVDGNVRRQILFESLGFSDTPSVEELNNAIYNMMTGSSGFGNKLKGWTLTRLAKYNNAPPTDEVVKAVTLAFSEYIINKL
ncbi:hypothetical protein [Clostridium saccharoperbutylacetonicum]